MKIDIFDVAVYLGAIGATFVYYLYRKEEKEAEKEKQAQNQVKNDKDENKSIISSAEL